MMYLHPFLIVSILQVVSPWTTYPTRMKDTPTSNAAIGNQKITTRQSVTDVLTERPAQPLFSLPTIATFLKKERGITDKFDIFPENLRTTTETFTSTDDTAKNPSTASRQPNTDVSSMSPGPGKEETTGALGEITGSAQSWASSLNVIVASVSFVNLMASCMF